MEGLYVPWTRDFDPPKPEIVLWNQTLATHLGLPEDFKRAEFWSAKAVPEGAAPVAMAYAGHQFGGFSPQLGDGRAMLMGEAIAANGERVDIHLKGSGATLFSRGGDGRAGVGPVLREYIISEAMHALGVPTTRSLAVTLTGDEIFREGVKPGAVLTRIAKSHIRVGSFEYLAARRDNDRLKALADYTMSRLYPEIEHNPKRYQNFLRAVSQAQAELIAKWMSIGFVHGVMNTDNMAISGETLDYGPCAFMESYDPATVFSSIDQSGRYAFGRQALMAQWNLARFSEAILPLLDPDEDQALQIAQEENERFAESFLEAWRSEFSRKLGLEDAEPALINRLLKLMQKNKSDFTLTFRALDDSQAFISVLKNDDEAKEWLVEWLAHSPDLQTIRSRNPVYIPRNHLVEDVILAAETRADFAPAKAFLEVLHQPFEENPAFEAYAAPAPENFGRYVTTCGT